jgi:hypothetical protein
MKRILFLAFATLTLFSCAKGSGVAPSTSELTSTPVAAVASISVNPTSIIVPKSISTNLHVYSIDTNGLRTDITQSATCSSSSSLVTLTSAGQISNTYTGSQVQNSTITCRYQTFSATIPVTIVPAVLQSLTLTKNTLTMGTNTSQSIEVYGNFVDSISSYVFALDMTQYVTWSTSSAAISSASLGTVSSGASAGVATITATLSSQSVNTTVTVSNGGSTGSVPRGVGLTGSYFDFITGPWSNVIGDPFESFFGSRIDAQVNFDWSTGTNNLGQPLYFGIRWTGRIYIPTTGTYTFYTRSDDGVRLWINDVSGTPVVNNWTLHAVAENPTAPMVLTGGQFYDVKMEYFENAGYSVAQLLWQGPGIAKGLIPQINLFPQ